MMDSPDLHHFDGFIEGPVNRWTGQPNFYGARRLREIWQHVQLGRNIGQYSRLHSGVVPLTMFDQIYNQILRDAVRRFGVPRSCGGRIVDVLRVDVAPGTTIVFDSAAVGLLLLADDALGRMFYRMREHSGPDTKVGPILLKRFEQAVESFESGSDCRLN